VSIVAWLNLTGKVSAHRGFFGRCSNCSSPWHEVSTTSRSGWLERWIWELLRGRATRYREVVLTSCSEDY